MFHKYLEFILFIVFLQIIQKSDSLQTIIITVVCSIDESIRISNPAGAHLIFFNILLFYMRNGLFEIRIDAPIPEWGRNFSVQKNPSNKHSGMGKKIYPKNVLFISYLF